MIASARSDSKMVATVECSRAAVVNVHREWILKPKARPQSLACGHHRLLKADSERKLRKSLSPTEEQTHFKLAGNLSQRATVNELFATHYTAQVMLVEELFESLYCWS
ncbi:hypothetical protein TNCV_350081 [Trichonephila clavipes]|nr:hypothetical protein TNCV_350081 [Trichonephila clavipes]